METGLVEWMPHYAMKAQRLVFGGKYLPGSAEEGAISKSAPGFTFQGRLSNLCSIQKQEPSH
jgi:hypothetical protein